MEPIDSGSIDAILARLSRIHLASSHLMDQMGLLYVGTHAARQGYRVRVIDQANTSLEKIRDLAGTSGTKVIGFYVDHENVHTTMSAITALKTADSSLLCVVGGPQASVVPWDERLLGESACDIAVRGEGEIAFTAILDWFLRGKGTLQEIEGITYRHAGGIARTRDRLPAADPDMFLVPDRTLNHERQRGNGIDYLVTSRGCPHRCAFCYEGRPEATYRPRDIAQVLAEVEELLRERRPAYINILDDTFTVDPERVMAFCCGMKELQSRYYTVKWFCEGRANVIVKHPEMVRAMVEAGLDRIQLGVETGNQHVLDAYCKNLTLDEIREAVRICAGADILSIFGNFIIGGAFESRETIDNSISFAEELLEIGLGRLEVNSTIYTPYPGTPMYENPGAFGLEMLDPDCVTGPGDNYAFVRTESLSKWEILHARQRFIEAVSTKMRDLFWTIPDELLHRHCEAYYRSGLKTTWFQLIEHTFNYSKYFSLPFLGDYRHLKGLPADAIEAYKPVRTVFIASSREGNLFLDLGHRKLELNDTASFIYEQCYGKLTTGEIIDKTREKRFPCASRNLTREVVLDFFGRMDLEKLLVFTGS
ncbi:B12-binding domain-containing radical SAM protein [Geobacter sp.]|uniref:B12-binding domain-containing radical SAM protein n=1 Tax=Geobacter sp. TaxID=46610 RepID=UPI0027B98D12|nr:radical SAM protein [Geobacter sp.]